MAAASHSGATRRSSSRGRNGTGDAKTGRNGTSRAGARSRASNGGAGSSRGGTAASPSRARGTGGAAQRPASRTAGAKLSDNGSSSGQPGKLTVGLTAAGAAVGMASGVLLGRRVAHSGRSVLGIPVPDKGALSGVSKQIGEAGRQFGQLAGEVRAVREKAEQIGRLLA